MNGSVILSAVTAVSNEVVELANDSAFGYRAEFFLSCEGRIRAHHRIPSVAATGGDPKGTTGGREGAREALSFAT